MTESDLPVVQLTPGRWGDPAQSVEVPEAALAALQHLGVRRPPEARTQEAVAPEGSAPDAVVELLGAEHVKVDVETRWAHTRGYSTPDLLRFRAGDRSDMPDAVVFPGSHEDVLGVLGTCSELGLAVVPYAGGTSVVGGLAPAKRFVAMDLRRLDQVSEIDEVSRTARLQAGVRGTAAESALADRGYTLGHFPQSYEGGSIGGYAASGPVGSRPRATAGSTRWWSG